MYVIAPYGIQRRLAQSSLEDPCECEPNRNPAGFLARTPFVLYNLSKRREPQRMPKVEDIIRDAESLPVEDRAIVVDSLLRTLNAPNPEIDRKWAAVARRRLDELRSGQVKAIPGEEVFARIRERFGG